MYCWIEGNLHSWRHIVQSTRRNGLCFSCLYSRSFDLWIIHWSFLFESGRYMSCLLRSSSDFKRLDRSFAISAFLNGLGAELRLRGCWRRNRNFRRHLVWCLSSCLVFCALAERAGVSSREGLGWNQSSDFERMPSALPLSTGNSDPSPSLTGGWRIGSWEAPGLVGHRWAHKADAIADIQSCIGRSTGQGSWVSVWNRTVGSSGWRS